MTNEVDVKTPVQRLRDELEQLLREAKWAHARMEEETGRADPDWAPWYAQFIVRRMHVMGWEVDWFPKPEVVEALTGPMGRTEVDAATARSYNPRPDGGPDFNHVSRRVPADASSEHRPLYRSETGERFYLGPQMTPEEYQNAFGVTAQRED